MRILFVARAEFRTSDVVAEMKRLSVFCYIGELICWMAMWEPGYLVGKDGPVETCLRV